MNYDVIVVGGGHAGCEAALASARLNHPTLMVTSNIKNIADMPCNPSIGGPAKGIIVREIDALGGEMGKNTDKAFLQMKMLNTKKGPAVQALRAQADKITYPQEMWKTISNQENLDVKEAFVDDLIVKDNKVCGVKLEDGEARAAAERAVRRFWDTPMRTGRRRYYDNCLYFFAILALSGHYVVY